MSMTHRHDPHRYEQGPDEALAVQQEEWRARHGLPSVQALGHRLSEAVRREHSRAVAIAERPALEEPTREQDQAAEAVALRWGRSGVDRLHGGLVRVSGLIDDVALEISVYDVDGTLVASNRPDPTTLPEDPRHEPRP